MKKLLPALLILTACNTQTSTHEVYSLIDDRTDSINVHPNSDHILPLFNLGNDKHKVVTVRYRQITDMQLNPIRSVQLQQARNILAETDMSNREMEILGFYDSVRLMLAYGNKQIDKRPYSTCFETICDELAFIESVRADKKVVIVYSNLFQNSTLASVYANPGLIETPKSLAMAFSKYRPLPSSLKGISLYFIFTAQNRVEEAKYLKIIEAYKILFEPLGVRISIAPDDALLQ